MKKIIALLLIGFTGTTYSVAQPQVQVNIDAATVFLNGAALSGTAYVTLPKGESDVIFTNVAGNVKQQTLSIGAENGVVVQSATFQNNYLTDSTLSPRAKKLQDSALLLKQIVAVAEDKKTVADEQLQVLRENKKVSGLNNGLSVTALQQLLDLIHTRMNNLLTMQRMLGQDIDKAREQISKLEKQLAAEQEKITSQVDSYW